jgi:uncharacterized membrane protein
VDLISTPFPPIWRLAAWALVVPLAAWAAWSAPWRYVVRGETAHVWFGGMLGLALLWMLKATIGSGFTFHLLGVSLLALLVGPQLALIGAALVVAIVTLLRDGLWANYALNVSVMAAVPALVTMAILRFAERRLPPNFFVYIFVVAFLGSMLAMAAAGVVASLAVVLGGGQPTGLVFQEYLPYFIYLAFGEATVTGMLVTLLVVYRPGWVTTFDDARYLRR